VITTISVCHGREGGGADILVQHFAHNIRLLLFIITECVDNGFIWLTHMHPMWKHARFMSKVFWWNWKIVLWMLSFRLS